MQSNYEPSASSVAITVPLPPSWETDGPGMYRRVDRDRIEVRIPFGAEQEKQNPAFTPQSPNVRFCEPWPRNRVYASLHRPRVCKSRCATTAPFGRVCSAKAHFRAMPSTVVRRRTAKRGLRLHRRIARHVPRGEQRKVPLDFCVWISCAMAATGGIVAIAPALKEFCCLVVFYHPPGLRKFNLDRSLCPVCRVPVVGAGNAYAAGVRHSKECDDMSAYDLKSDLNRGTE